MFDFFRFVCVVQSFNSMLLVGWSTAVWFCQFIDSQLFDRAFNKCRHCRSGQSPLLKLFELIPMKSSSNLSFANDRPATLRDRNATQGPRCNRNVPQCDRDATAMSW
jgi:hypothetical protein